MHINPLYHKSFYNNALALVSGEQILLCPSPSSIPFFFVLRYMHVADLLNYCCCCPFWLSMAPQLCALDLVTALLCFGICPPPSSPVVELHVTYGVRVFTKQPKAIDIWVATIENLPSIARDFNQPPQCLCAPNVAAPPLCSPSINSPSRHSYQDRTEHRTGRSLGSRFDWFDRLNHWPNTV